MIEKHVELPEPWLHSASYRWEIVRGKFVLCRRKFLNIGMRETNRLSLSMGGVGPRSLDDVDGLQATSYETYQIFEKDDLVFKLIDLENIKTSRVGIVPERGIMSPAYIRISPEQHKVFPRFVYWWFTHLYWQQVFNNLGGGVRQSMGYEELLELNIPIPPLPTQKAIATFLDRKTAAIDALIEKKQKLLDLLAEKRAALINQAVTRGLDPNAPMKDSGIPWIGEIPAHWEVKRLKHVSNFITSGSRGWSQYYSSIGPLFLRITNVARDGIDLLLDESKKQSVVPPPGAEGIRTFAIEGDILITITADLGSVGVVPGGIGDAYISQHVALCRPNGTMMSRLLAYMARGLWGRVHYELAMNGGTKVGLTLDDVRDTPIAVPPMKEQQELLSRLDRDLERCNAIINILNCQVERLREYRQAVITAAVTGQLAIAAEVG